MSYTSVMRKYNVLRRPGHPIAPPGGVVSRHRFRLYEKIGPGPHPCHWCGKQVQWRIGYHNGMGDDLVSDHVDKNWRNDDPSNLVPSCVTCNNRRARINPILPDEVVFQNGRWRERAELRNCVTCGQPFPGRLSDKRPNKGRFCSRSCARKNLHHVPPRAMGTPF